MSSLLRICYKLVLRPGDCLVLMKLIQKSSLCWRWYLSLIRTFSRICMVISSGEWSSWPKCWPVMHLSHLWRAYLRCSENRVFIFLFVSPIYWHEHLEQVITYTTHSDSHVTWDRTWISLPVTEARILSPSLILGQAGHLGLPHLVNPQQSWPEPSLGSLARHNIVWRFFGCLNTTRGRSGSTFCIKGSSFNRALNMEISCIN